MISDYVMTEHNCTGKTVEEDSVGLACYTMDSHHTSRVVVDGVVRAVGMGATTSRSKIGTGAIPGPQASASSRD